MTKTLSLALAAVLFSGSVALAEAKKIQETFRTSRDLLHAVTVHKPECGMTQAQARDAVRGKVRGQSTVMFGNDRCGFEFTRVAR